VIHIFTLASLLEHRHRPDADCSRGDRWAEMPLADLVTREQGSRRLPVQVTWSACGSTE
jgi:hypothetical protein